MPFNGTGAFTRAFNWVQDKAGGVKISDARMDAEFDNFANGLSNILLKDGQQAATAKIPFAQGINIAASAPSNPQEGDLRITSTEGLLLRGSSRERSPGAIVEIDDFISAGSNSVDITIPQTYQRVRIELTNLVFSGTTNFTASVFLGGVWSTSGYYGTQDFLDFDGVTTPSTLLAANGTSVRIANAEAGAGRAQQATFDIIKPQDTSRPKHVFFEMFGFNATNTVFSSSGAFVSTANNNALTALRLVTSATFGSSLKMFGWR